MAYQNYKTEVCAMDKNKVFLLLGILILLAAGLGFVGCSIAYFGGFVKGKRKFGFGGEFLMRIVGTGVPDGPSIIYPR